MHRRANVGWQPAAIETDDPRIARALRYIADHLDEPIYLADIASVAAVERSHFSRLFHRKTGWHVFAFIAHCRILHAKQLLRSTDLKVFLVAARVGYGDVRTFERAFKRYAGTTPNGYRMASVRVDHLLMSLDHPLDEGGASTKTGEAARRRA